MIEILLQAEGALSLGLLDRAEILYRQVAIADPRNSIAVVGLARVALERGDEPGALAQARRALAIDPENVAAQRMVERLREVLAYRGVQVPDGTDGADAAPADAVETARPSEPSARGASGPPEPAPAPAPLAASASSPVPAPAPPVVAQPARRSLVDRLLRRR